MHHWPKVFNLRDLLGLRGDRREKTKPRIYDPILDPDLAVEHPLLEGILAYYQELSPQGEPPAWSLFLPSRVDPDLLPHLLVLDCTAPLPGGFRWRLMGTAILDVIDRDTTGETFNELYTGDTLRRMLIAPLWVQSNRRALRTRSCGAFTTGRFRPSENLFLPFTEGEGAVTRILVAPMFDPVEPD